MREVRREPRMALDGGDGLVFYRVIARVWAAKLCPGGFCAVEVGAGQAAAVAALFEEVGLTGWKSSRIWAESSGSSSAGENKRE